ncbi:hypothetical protein NIES267_32950 [Calothrix parasitica NIES-267]|uniref:Photosystem reaction center subunit H n=1 Tax=Calothrix parasitica NIES-267 TaxID=1973488 RepID=A0A1Z4LRM2_9CYAN|nr:hypothetical protein NIES267_32950 [Calothrix parasitica NIES-267]
MTLYKLEDFDPNYKEVFGGEDIKKMSLYTQGGDKVGSVEDALVDHEGRFRYLVIDTGPLFLGKKVLLPIGLSRLDYNQKRVYVDGLSKEQVENLPEYDENMTVDYDYEERVRGAYRTSEAQNVAYNKENYNYQNDSALYGLNDRDHSNIKLYEERLITSKTRIKSGEVTVGKHIETETATVSVPVEKERVVIERTTPTGEATVVDPGTVNFGEGEVARVELYEEQAQITKEAYVREEVRVKKVVEQDTVEAKETVRREELDIDTQGDLRVNDSNKNERI